MSSAVGFNQELKTAIRLLVLDLQQFFYFMQ
jgi:hypothetical protein